MDSQPKDKLKEIAKDILLNRVFTDRHISNPKDIPMVFMVLNFLRNPGEDSTGHEKAEVEHTFQDMASNCGMLYEYYDQKGPMSVNGYPIFFSARMLNKEDADEVFRYYEEYKKALEAVV